MDQAALERIQNDIASHDIVLYLRGTPVFPQCSGSAQAVQILGLLGVPYHSVDVLSDPGVRQSIHDFSNWPLLPQLYIKGTFIGGNDIMREMAETGELQDLLRAQGVLGASE